MKPLPIIPFPDDPERQARFERDCQWVTGNLTQQEIDDLLIAAVEVGKELILATVAGREVA